MKKYSTPSEKVILSLIGYDEPNNGRELNIVEIEENGVNITNKLEPNWNRIIYNLNKFEFNKPELNFCYIPFESGGILYNFQTSDILNLNFNSISPAYRNFIGNRFSENQLVVVYDTLLQMVNLNSMVTKNIEAKENERFDWFEFLDEDTIEVSVVEIKKTGKQKRLHSNG